MKSFEEINKEYETIIKKIYQKYSYLNLDYELYKKLVMYAFVSAKNKSDNSNIDKYFLKCLDASMQEYIKTMFEDVTLSYNLFCHFMGSKIKTVYSYSEVIIELKKVTLFLNSVYDAYTFSHFQTFLKNPKLCRMIKTVVTKNLSDIEKGKFDFIFDNEILISFIEVYCSNNNIEINYFDDKELTTDAETDIYSIIFGDEIISGMPDHFNHEETRKLLRKAFMGDVKSKEEIVIHNLKLVLSIARKYVKHCKKLEFMELFQEGIIGLMKAIEKYDESMGCAFSTYAVFWIRQKIVRVVQDTDRTIRIPAYKEEMLIKYRQVSQRLECSLGREASIIEISNALNISVHEVRFLETIINDASSLNILVGEEDDTELIELIEDKSEDNIIDVFIGSNLIEEFKKSLDRIESITDKEKEILYLRIGIGTYPRTLEEIGRIYRVTRERIRQIEAKALRKFRCSKEAKAFIEYSVDPDRARRVLREARENH